MFEKKKKSIESFIERNNGYIQIVFLVMTLLAGIVSNQLNWQNEQTIIIEIAILLSFEIIVLNIKDSISQDKLNRLIYNNDKVHGVVMAETEEGYNKFPTMLSIATKDFFVSGIACNGVWSHTSKIERLLENGSHVRVLITTESALENNLRLYYGIKNQEDDISAYIEDARKKIGITLNTLKTNEIIKKYYCEGKFELRRTNIPFATAYVGINILSGNSINKELKVTHYVAGKSTAQCPNMIFNPLDNSYWYGYYIESLSKIWEEAESVRITECIVQKKNK